MHEHVSEALHRQWLILSMLPRAPPRKSASEIQQRLRLHGLEVHLRTVQRDLHELARVFPLVWDERTRPHGWRWAEDADFLCALPIVRAGQAAARVEIDLRLRVRYAVARSVAEGLRGREGSARKVLLMPGREEVIVAARVPDSSAMRRFLFGFGDDVEVLAPTFLRADFEGKAVRVAAVYAERRDTMTG